MSKLKFTDKLFEGILADVLAARLDGSDTTLEKAIAEKAQAAYEAHLKLQPVVYICEQYEHFQSENLEDAPDCFSHQICHHCGNDIVKKARLDCVEEIKK